MKVGQTSMKKRGDRGDEEISHDETGSGLQGRRDQADR